MTKLETAQKTTIWNRNFICVVLANMMLCLAHFAVNPLVASYATDILGQGPRVMGLLTGMFFGVALAMRPVSGPMITKVDKRALLIAVFALGSAANIGYALFQTVPLFVTFRFLNGVQYSFVGSLIMTLAGDNLPPEKLASGMGIYGVGGAVGSALAPSIGITLVDFGTRLRDLSFGYKL
ncbi:MAG: MFS transporter, partial [Oscillospiraceae bacterium]|nr:MFS transporter [Oscillospiraceae bacterium]